MRNKRDTYSFEGHQPYNMPDSFIAASNDNILLTERKGESRSISLMRIYLFTRSVKNLSVYALPLHQQLSLAYNAKQTTRHSTEMKYYVAKHRKSAVVFN